MHAFMQVPFNHLPHQRRLSGAQKEGTETMLKFKPTKSSCKTSVSKTSDQVVIFKGLHNMSASCKEKRSYGPLEAVADPENWQGRFQRLARI